MLLDYPCVLCLWQMDAMESGKGYGRCSGKSHCPLNGTQREWLFLRNTSVNGKHMLQHESIRHQTKICGRHTMGRAHRGLAWKRNRNVGLRFALPGRETAILVHAPPWKRSGDCISLRFGTARIGVLPKGGYLFFVLHIAPAVALGLLQHHIKAT